MVAAGQSHKNAPGCNRPGLLNFAERKIAPSTLEANPLSGRFPHNRYRLLPGWKYGWICSGFVGEASDPKNKIALG